MSLEEKLKEVITKYEKAGHCGCDYQCSCGDLEAYAVAATLTKLLPKKVELNMITAEEAKKRVEERIEGEAAEWLKMAESAINAAVLKKALYIYLPYKSDTYSFCEKELKKYGYRVEFISGNMGNSSEVKVSW